jgi:outer membrane protein
MLIKIKSYVLSTVWVLLLPLGLAAQGSNATKIGTLHILRAISESAEGKQALGEFNKKAEAKRDELQRKNSEIEQLQKQLQDQARTLNDESRAALSKNIDSKTTELQRAQQDAQKEFGDMQNEIINRIGNKLVPVVQQYAKENNYSLIMDSSNQSYQLIYFDPAIDITDDIIKRYDASSVSSATPAPSGPRPTSAQPKPPLPPANQPAPAKPK